MFSSRCRVEGAYLNRNSESGTIITLFPTQIFDVSWHHIQLITFVMKADPPGKIPDLAFLLNICRNLNLEAS